MCVQLCYWMDVVVVMEYEIFRGWGRGGIGIILRLLKKETKNLK